MLEPIFSLFSSHTDYIIIRSCFSRTRAVYKPFFAIKSNNTRRHLIRLIWVLRMMRGWVVGWIRTCLKKIIFDTFNYANLEIKSPQSKHQVTCPASSASSPKSLRFHWTNYEKMVSDWNGWRRVERTHCVCNEMYRFILFFFLVKANCKSRFGSK